jgi:hypothetical protein
VATVIYEIKLKKHNTMYDNKQKAADSAIQQLQRKKRKPIEDIFINADGPLECSKTYFLTIILCPEPGRRNDPQLSI